MQEKLIFCIVIHDPQLIELFERTKKYERLGSYVYVLVGKHEKDYASPIIFQCDRASDNIESNKNFLAYTGWYAVAKNFGYNHEYICFLEYDTDLTERFDADALKNSLEVNDMGVCGFFSLGVNNSFLNRDIFSDKLINFLKKEGIREITPNNHQWIVSNNVVFRSDVLRRLFSDDITKQFFTFLGEDKMAGHFLERYTTVYCYLNDIKFFIEPDMFIHRALDSHNTQNRKFGSEGYEQFKIANKISN